MTHIVLLIGKVFIAQKSSIFNTVSLYSQCSFTVTLKIVEYMLSLHIPLCYEIMYFLANNWLNSMIYTFRKIFYFLTRRNFCSITYIYYYRPLKFLTSLYKRFYLFQTLVLIKKNSILVCRSAVVGWIASLRIAYSTWSVPNQFVEIWD